MDSSASSPYPFLRDAYRTRFVLLYVLVPFVLVSLLFAADSKGGVSWFSSYYSSSSSDGGGGGGSGGGVSLGESASYSSPTSPADNGSGDGGGGGDGGGASVKKFESDTSPPTSPSVNGGGDGGGGATAQDDLDVEKGGRIAQSFPPVAAPSPITSPAPAPKPFLTRRRDIKLQKLELRLARARAAIKEAYQSSKNNSSVLPDKDFAPQGPVYRNAHAFHRSYLEMEKLFKVYVYEEGEPPLFHDGPCKSIYSSEGRFIHSLEMDSRFRTRNPDRAHVFFLPFSVVKMVKTIYIPNSHDMSPLTKTIADYINVIADRHPFWNRSLGADHFMLSCHDWGPYVSKVVPHLYNNSIRALCNANTTEGFNPSKDVSLPEINIKTDTMRDMMGGPSASGRSILAFFAGGLHGPVRPLLLEAWKDKDPDVQVHEYLPKGVSYYDMMRKSKFCLCPSGYEVASPRIVEAIFLGCVPVTISDHYVLPFSDVLNWKAFSVQVPVEDIPNIKTILMGISSRQYIRMQRRVAIVRRHFEVNGPPKRFDVFHMILHSIWLRRLNVRVHELD
ncbi:putative glycosyltransferase isoform X1 [Canna indica]|uniref:Glycosyltransferase isoform X1 n=1 Tax=Canna indica TaxID=4628 RepID=A0AAQ3KUY7_9LILI|nr:putative glycosyltransferase isoform X1 [Canna indica]